MLLPLISLTLSKIVVFITYLFLSSILDSSYFSMCYLSEQDANLTEI